MTRSPVPTTDVFTAGSDGIHTYRIPALLALPSGTLLAFAEARKFSTTDASPTDLVLKRSLDGGQTWGPLYTVLQGRESEAIMNPCVFLDGNTVILLCLNAHKVQRGQHLHLLFRSHDEGATWSPPEWITDRLGDDAFVPGPGVGLVLRSGRWFVPGYTNHFDESRTRITSHARAALSDDHGVSWNMSENVPFEMSNESQAVERSNGEILLNFRIQKGADSHPGCRGIAISHDQGEHWDVVGLDHALPEAPCQAGLIRWPSTDPALSDRFLFSNPDAQPGPTGGARTRLTIRLSLDGGRTWPASRLLHPGRAAYSVPAPMPDGDVGILYECGDLSPYERIRFARLPAEWLMAAFTEQR